MKLKQNHEMLVALEEEQAKENAREQKLRQVTDPQERKRLEKIYGMERARAYKSGSINRMDIIQREGYYPLPPQAPKTLGVEFSGIVEAVAEGTEGSYKIGDEVFGLAYGGAYAEYVAVSTKMLLHKPEHLSWEQAAGVPEVSGPWPASRRAGSMNFGYRSLDVG